MLKRTNFWYTFLALLLVLALMIPVLAACDDDDDDEKDTTATATVTAPTTTSTTPTTTTSATKTPEVTTPASGKPVKIGALSAWSGPAGMSGILADQVIKVVEDQVERMGGILGGRPLEFVRYDSAGQVAKVEAGFNKMVLDDKVSAIVFGGATAATTAHSAKVAEDLEVLFVGFGYEPADLIDYSYTVRATNSFRSAIDTTHDFIPNQLKPETVAILGDDDAETRERVGITRAEMEDAGIEVVSVQYVPLGTTDFTPYLTNIKYDNPDVLIQLHSLQQAYLTTFKQIEELGGWGDINYVSGSPASSTGIAKMAGAEGTYHWVLWAPGLPYAGAQKFEDDFTKKHGNLPSVAHAYFYFTLWTAIEAIQLAGTDDPATVAAAARSGELTWDSPAGPLEIGTNGETDVGGHIMLMTGGQLHSVTSE